MTSLYTKDSVIGKLRKWFSGIFSEETKPTEQHLFELALSVLALDGFQSVKSNFERFISEISSFELKSFYYALNESKIALSDRMENLMKAALSLAAEKTEALVLSVDDTLTEKFGEKFERWSKLYDHAAHNGSAYLNGRCFVSLTLSVPLKAVPGSGYFAGCRKVKTMLFGKRSVWAIVTKGEKSGQRRLFPCTKDPKELRFNLSLADGKAALFANADADFLPLTIYSLRRDIETAYYEQKTFWALGDYPLRSGRGIERLVNLLTLRYSSIKLLPYSCGDFCALRDSSPQKARFALGRLIRQEIFFTSLASCPIYTNLKAGHLKRTRFSSFFRAKMKSYRMKIKLSIRKVYNIRFKREQTHLRLPP